MKSLLTNNFWCVLLLSTVVSTETPPSTLTSSTGIIHNHKDYFPSHSNFFIQSSIAIDRLNCAKYCQYDDMCQTAVFFKLEKVCHLFSEHIQYGTLVERQDAMVIQLDKDFFKRSLQTLKQFENKQHIPALLQYYRQKTAAKTIKTNICQTQNCIDN
ncbi:unnamed protein product [Didymodactylos carnosus]|uniref:Apple domain-containing protein n=1 Tax=Didymodactylos carnosus TaxID=1234261 RepID=A0A813Z2F3_9BILA|nr:unnamed protein product [Didymodactylos carnosus]CAF1497923.1 unnamed protein product [Didymodactylos carnosus]CAF3677074.1 unnamed protein product [Didymodactylos carnosus]CAF4286716.1 unnamed protein product [Didymodactylos carnosus]